jgi:hypothetical protein
MMRRRMLRRPDRKAVCDACGQETGLQMHELIPRSKTVGSTQARELSYQGELCSLLCQTCHDQSGDLEPDLWQFNFDLYGTEPVLAALALVQASLRNPVAVRLPERISS